MKILIGGLIHNRPQVDSYLRHLARLDTSGHEVQWHLVCDVCYPSDFPAFDILDRDELGLGNPSWDRASVEAGESWWRRRESRKPSAYRHLARLRNMLRGQVLAGDYDALLNIDSDIIVPPDLLQRLAAAGKPWVSALVNNRPGDRRIWNVYKFKRSRAGRPAIQHFQAIGQGAEGKGWPGPEGSSGDPQHPGEDRPLIAGAVCLYSRELLEQVPFVEHQCGEDTGFGIRAIEAGYRAWYLPIVCEHLMYADEGEAQEAQGPHMTPEFVRDGLQPFLLSAHREGCAICPA